jgi:hypothetical protein
MRRLIAVLALALSSVACTPEEVTLFQSLTPDQQQAVVNMLWPPQGCVDAMRRVWPESEWRWAEGIMWRESRHTPTAYNPSGASGCWQMMMPLHANRFRAVGCAPSAWADPLCNSKAALHLFREAGRSPWNL